MVEKHYPTHPDGELDAGADRDRRRPRPCCARVTLADGRFGWCRDYDGHDGKHSATVSTPTERPTFMPKGSR